MAAWTGAAEVFAIADVGAGNGSAGRTAMKRGDET